MDEEDIVLETSDSGEVIITRAQLRNACGYDILEEQFLALQASHSRLLVAFENLLAYTNNVDLRIQELSGEPVVKKTVIPHIADDGTLNLSSSHPPVPQDLLQAFNEAGKKVGLLETAGFANRSDAGRPNARAMVRGK